jgi:hypothetical protein
MVWRGAFVRHIGNIAKDEESVPKPRRNPHLLSVSGLQGHATPFAKVRRRAPEIDSDVEDDTAHGAYELALRLLQLKMQPAQYVANRAAVIVLRE